MKKTILILLTVLLAVSCSQVVYDNLPPEDISADNVSFLVERVRAGNDDTLKLKFTPVAYVSTYGYQVDNNSVVDINKEYMGYEDGYITYQLPDSESYSDTGLVKLFSRSDSEDAVIAIAEYSFLTTSDVAPNVIVSSRYENYVELYVSANDPEIEYKVTLTDKTESNEPVVISSLKAKNGTITVPGLYPDHEYTLVVAHKSAGEDYGQKTTSLDVGKYEYSVVISFEVTDTAFTASEIPEGINFVDLRKIADNEESYKEIMSADVNNGTAVFNFSDMKSLESGIFYVYAETASEKYISNTVRATTPIIVKGRTENYRSVDLYIDFADDVREDESVEFTVYDPAGANASIQDFKSNDGLDVLTISGIKSKKTYDEILLTANKPGFFSISSIVKDVTTKSFADKYYEWEGKFEGSNTDTNFVIYVKNVPDGSEYPYYVYFSTNDDVFKYEDVGGYKDIYEQTSYRIMPLVDTSEAIGEPITDSNHVVYFDNSKNPENLKKQNSSYVVNSFKWNSLRSFAKPDTWFISDFDISVDKVVTYTTSKAFGILVPTTTTFEFMEYRENGIALPVIKFKNVCSMGIEKNADTAGPQKYGDYDEKDGANCWYLTLTNFNEGGAE